MVVCTEWEEFRSLDLHRAKTLLAHPETYWGNVNPIGPHSVYDEAKR